ncbi:SAM-dependent methyltransferase [Luedemannella helvata]|uniref:SAM-dependent methyltransferase n=1 Tax=Luedemannella helvata TaxID=349315 RepID=A0ABP4WGD3_9ACTN
MEQALYGPAGFFTTGAGPAAHFRTSSHASGPFLTAVLALLTSLDAALDNPPVVDLVDVGAGRGELLLGVRATAPPALRERLRLVAVELAPRPGDLPADIAWTDRLPDSVTGLLTAVEWLDNVPLDVVREGRYVRVDDTLGDPVAPEDAAWLARWWPGDGPAEVGRTRDLAWAAAVSRLTSGLALAVDYGHVTGERPASGTLTGYRAGRQVAPVADGSCDITAHVAIDSVAAAVGRAPAVLMRQSEALRALGADGRRPPISLASTDPAGYVRALSAASLAAELTDPGGLGSHYWLLHGVGVSPPDLLRPR